MQALEFTKIDLEARVGSDKKFSTSQEIPLVGVGIKIEEILVIIIEITGPIIEIDLAIITELMTGDIPIGPMMGAITDLRTGVEATIGKAVETNKIIGVMTLDRDMEIEVKVGIGPDILAVTEPGAEIEVETEMDKCKTDPELCQMTEED